MNIEHPGADDLTPFKDTIFRWLLPDRDRRALELYRLQARYNPVYARYHQLLGYDPEQVSRLEDVPYLPIRFFKQRHVSVHPQAPGLYFTSSGTSGGATSRHPVYDPAFYLRGAQLHFEQRYGPLSQYAVLALLPAYLERQGSSLVYMAQHFIEQAGHPASGFFLDDLPTLSGVLRRMAAAGQPVLLLGVTFALLDLAEQFPQALGPHTVVMETGGMKGRRREMVRAEVHEQLQEAFGLAAIHSEYGMTELFSQAYSQGQGFFETPPWMQVHIRRVDDPLSRARSGKTGGINVMDLANVESCAFIQTDDLGRQHPDGRFEVLGRFDHAEIRGCNLMVL